MCFERQSTRSHTQLHQRTVGATDGAMVGEGVGGHGFLLFLDATIVCSRMNGFD